MRRHFTLLAVAMFLAIPSLASEGQQFHYRIPPGWVDLLDPTVNTSRFPEAAVREARSGRYVVYAIDPANVSKIGANASLNIIELHSTGAVTPGILRAASSDAANEAQGLGYVMEIIGVRIAKLGGVDVGVTDSTMSTIVGEMRLRQFLIPGETRTATLTYACKVSEFSRYESMFDASAMATTGAVSHSPGINWRRAWQLAAVGGFAGAVVAMLVALVGIKLKAARSTAPASVPAAPPSTWNCPDCRRHVPSRIAECRCGALRPA